MRAVDLPADQISNRTAHEHVRREMLLAGNAGQTDRRGAAVRERLRQPSWILVGEEGGERKRQRRMSGGHGCLAAALEELSASIAFKWPVPAKRELERFIHTESVQHCLSA